LLLLGLEIGMCEQTDEVDDDHTVSQNESASCGDDEEDVKLSVENTLLSILGTADCHLALCKACANTMFEDRS
jgi:hypothetical protein